MFNSTYCVGDRVLVVSTPNYDAACGWVDDMDQYCGRVVEISEVIDDFRYRVKEDPEYWCWSDDCFDGPVGVLEFAPSPVEEIFDLFS